MQGNIKAIPFDIKLKEIYVVQLDDIIATVLKYKNHAADITDAIRRGNFVRFKDGSIKAQELRLKEMTNVFTFQGRIEDGYCKLQEFEDPIPTTQLQAIPIDGQSDRMIYYDPVVAASIVMSDQPIPVHQTDYSYYMDSFTNCKQGDKTYKQIVQEKEFQFVHEVQQWLIEKEGASYLKIRQKTFEEIIG